MASISGSAKSSSYEPYALEMPSLCAASSALLRSREAIAAMSLHSPFCIPGITFLMAMLAAPITPSLLRPLTESERLCAGTVAVEDLQLHTVSRGGPRYIQAAATVANDELEKPVAQRHRLKLLVLSTSEGPRLDQTAIRGSHVSDIPSF